MEAQERRLTQEFPRYYDLYVPGGEGSYPLVIAMHGYGGNKGSMMRLVRRINESDFAIASLQAPHQHVVVPDTAGEPLGFGFGWLTNFYPSESVALHADVIKRVLADLVADSRVDAAGAFLVGFSQAVGLNFRFAFSHPKLVRGVVGICGGIPGDWDDGDYRDADFDVLYIAARDDEFYAPERMEANAEALRRRARSVDFRIFDAGHEIPREANSVISQWLVERV